MDPQHAARPGHRRTAPARRQRARPARRAARRRLHPTGRAVRRRRSPTRCGPPSSPAPRGICSRPPVRAPSPTGCAASLTAASTPILGHCSPCGSGAARPEANAPPPNCPRASWRCCAWSLALGPTNRSATSYAYRCSPCLSMLTVKSHHTRIGREFGTEIRPGSWPWPCAPASSASPADSGSREATQGSDRVPPFDSALRHQGGLQVRSTSTAVARHLRGVAAALPEGRRSSVVGCLRAANMPGHWPAGPGQCQTPSLTLRRKGWPCGTWWLGQCA